MRRREFFSALPVAVTGSAGLMTPQAAYHYWAYIGTHSREKGQGIYACRFNAQTGEWSDVFMAADVERPTWLVVSRDQKYLYSVSELGNDGRRDGYLIAFAIDKKTGRLERINQVSSDGGGPTHMSLDKSGKTLVVATFGGGSTNSFRILSGGALSARVSRMQHSGSGPHRRQTSPHAHAAVVSPDNRFVLSPDLGADRVFVFRLDAARGALALNDPPFVQAPPGYGPRHLAFHPNGKFAYLMNELVARITVFAWDPARGRLTEIQLVDSYPAGYECDRSGAEIEVDRAGRFLYSSNRTNNTIGVFSIDPHAGTLTPSEHVSSGGRIPWSFSLAPGGGFLVVTNQASDDVAVLRVEAQTGRLTPTGSSVKAPAPVCVAFAAA